MPIYEYECPFHGIYESYRPLEDADREYVTCMETDGMAFNFCGHDAYRVMSVCAMHPDKYWSGQVVQGKYVTKKSQIDSDIVPATRSNLEYAKKRSKQVKVERAEKFSNNLKLYLNQELSGIYAAPDGYTEKQRRTYERQRTNSGASGKS